MFSLKRWIWGSCIFHGIIALVALFWSPSPTLPNPPAGEFIAEIELTGGGRFIAKNKTPKTQLKSNNKPERKPERKTTSMPPQAAQKKPEPIADKKAADKKAADKKAADKKAADKKAADKKAADKKAADKKAADKKAADKKAADKKAADKKAADKKAADKKAADKREAKLIAKLKQEQADQAILNAIKKASNDSRNKGNKKTTSSNNRVGSGLSFTQKKGLIDKMLACWNDQGASKSAVVDFDLNKNGIPYNFNHVSGSNVAYLMAQEAVKKCAPYTGLPAQKYNSWKNLRVKFVPFNISVY